MALKQLTEIKGIPLQGSAITVREKALLPFGAFSMLQNIRGRHPGIIKRPGQRKLHTEADGPTNKILSLYQFKKGRVTEEAFFAQISDGDILKAAADPPGVTTGAFGDLAFNGSDGQIPASWGNIADKLIFSDGVDQHQIYGGSSSYVDKFIVFRGTAAMPPVPTEGEDYSDEVSDGQSSTVAVLDLLGTYATHNCLMIKTPVPAKSFTFTIPLPNSIDSVASLYYWNGGWVEVTAGWDDATSPAGATLALSGGTMSFTDTALTDIIPKYAYGSVGFWYQVRFTVALDAQVELSGVTFDSSFQDIMNVWDGMPADAVECYFYDVTAGTYELYASGSVEVGGMIATDKLFIISADPIEAVYVDVGPDPNTTAATTINAGYYWDGNSFESVGTVTDGSNGISNAGWVTFPRKAAQPHQFRSSQYYAYVYYFTVDKTLSADIILGIQTMPYFDIDELGKARCNCIWKDRAVLTFDLYSEYLYLSASGQPMMLNGLDYGILETGDGRAHKIVAIRKFHNEMMVWQEEKGVEGGTLTLFEGYSPETFGKLVLSSRIGTMNNKSVAVVDGVLVRLGDAEQIKDLVFFLSRHGVFVTDGRSVSLISDNIQNYFDPTKSECIKRGCESEMWLKHDSAFNVIRIGLVSGSSATVPNVFPVFDLLDKTWSFDSLAQPLSCMEEVEAASGNVPVLQVGGGTADGTVYQLNYGTNDVTTPIDSYVQPEFGLGGQYLLLRELLVRCKTQSAGNIKLTVEKNGIAAISDKTLSMVAEVTNQLIRRHRLSLNIQDQLISIKLQHGTASQEMYLEELGVNMSIWERR